MYVHMIIPSTNEPHALLNKGFLSAGEAHREERSVMEGDTELIRADGEGGSRSPRALHSFHPPTMM